MPRLSGWGTQRLRVQWCATIPHCAPLECGGWMCRAAIDMSLLWSERHQHTKIQETVSIVGARLPRSTGWGTQRLRVQWCATILYMRSSGARGLDVSRCYRHIAPLERKAPMHQNSRDGIHRRGEVSSPSGLGDPTPTGAMVCDNTILRSSGARGLDASRCYRHIAPLERKAPMHQNSRCVMHRRGLVVALL